jgi:hypothetical protein
MLLAAVAFVVGEHIVEVGDIGHADPGLLHGGQDPRSAGFVEGLAQVEGIGDRIQHGLLGHIGLARVQGGG